MSLECLNSLASQESSGTPLLEAELAFLVNMLIASPQLAVPADHPVFARFSITLCKPGYFASVRQRAMELCLALVMHPQNRQPVLELLESAHAEIDAVIHACLANLNFASIHFLAQAVVFFSIATHYNLRCEYVLELLDYSLDTVVEVLCACLRTMAGGGERKTENGVLSLTRLQVCLGVEGQASIVANMLSMLRELVSWKMYEVLSRHAKIMASSSSNGTPIHTLSKGFHAYVGHIIQELIVQKAFVDVTRYYSTSLGGIPAEAGCCAHLDTVARETLNLIENVLTLTDLFSFQLRKHLANTGILPTFFAPYLRSQLMTVSRSLSTRTLAAAIMPCRVIATLAFSVRANQHFLMTDTMARDALDQLRLTRPSAGEGGQMEKLKARTSSDTVELVAQLVRLVVNGHMMDSAATVERVWRKALTAPQRLQVGLRLANPMRRRQPVDLYSPCYRAMRPVFSVVAAEGALGAAGVDGSCNDLTQRKKQRPNQQRRRQRRAMLKAAFEREDRLANASAAAAPLEVVALAPTSGAEEKEAEQLAQLTSEDEGEEVGTAEAASEDISTPFQSVEADPLSLAQWRRKASPVGVPSRYLCALSCQVIRSVPVISPHGYVFDRDTIIDYLAQRSLCPICGEPLYVRDLIVDANLQRELDNVRFNFINAM